MKILAPNTKVHDQATIIKEAESLLAPRALAKMWIDFCNNTNKLGSGRMQGAHLASAAVVDGKLCIIIDYCLKTSGRGKLRRVFIGN